MKTQILDICPDCGGNLKGNYCAECKCYWYFKKVKNERTKIKRD